MDQIVIATLNSKYIHASFGLRYLRANMGELEGRTRLIEFDVSQRSHEICELILSCSPKIVGLGVYIWNAEETLSLVGIIRRVAPELVIVLGGPEISYETEDQELSTLVDYIVTGEADLTFPALCRDILAGTRPAEKIIKSPLPDLSQIKLPYYLYAESDIAHRVIYIEASRGCPFSCEFCLSSLEIPVRQFELDVLLGELDNLLSRGVTQFKFVDRTFNLNLKTSKTLLNFFLERFRPGLFVHFEMIPDRFPEELREIVKKFPLGALQFEVGIQSFNQEVCKLISRRQDFKKVEENLRFLRQETGVHIHADLIAGLPGETIESFGLGFNRLIELGPQEIQVGILKRLRGTPITRHTEEWGMVYNPEPPYEILANRLIDFPTMQRLSRFARYWDLLGNSGNFTNTTPLIWLQQGDAFKCFLSFSDWLYSETGQRSAFGLKALAKFLHKYLCSVVQLDPAVVLAALESDFQRCGRKDLPDFMVDARPKSKSKESTLLPPRQIRHLG